MYTIHRRKRFMHLCTCQRMLTTKSVLFITEDTLNITLKFKLYFETILIKMIADDAEFIKI